MLALLFEKMGGQKMFLNSGSLYLRLSGSIEIDAVFVLGLHFCDLE